MATLEHVAKAYGKRVVHADLQLTIRRGERWCVMGKNGAGKSTLLKMVAGALAPDSGTVRLGASLQMGYFAQQALDLLDPDLTVEEQLQKDFPHESIGALRNLAGAFQFSGDEIDKKIRALSGGEKTRLVIARMLLNPPNFLVLDEPTNHLDLATKEMLIEALKNFEGTMLFVSHDREFLRGPEQPRARTGRGERHGRARPRLPRVLRRVRGAHRPRGAGHSFLQSASTRCGTTHLRTVAAKNLRERRAPPFLSAVSYTVSGCDDGLDEGARVGFADRACPHRGPRRRAPAVCTARRRARTRVRLRLRVRR